MFQTTFVGIIKIHIFIFRTYFQKSCLLWYISEKYGRARQDTWQYYRAHSHWMLDNSGYRQPQSEYI